jgi:hypothetical protein
MTKILLALQPLKCGIHDHKLRLMRTTIAILASILALANAQTLSALSSTIQITKTNNQSECPFILVKAKDENGTSGHLRLFRVIVTAPSGFKPENISGYLSVFQDGKLITACAIPNHKLERNSKEVDTSVKDRSVVIEFTVSSDFAAASKFNVTLSDPEGSSVSNYWFYLHDFEDAG